MENNEPQIDIFGDGMRIFLDYVGRQYKKNPDYKPHPLIRALDCALQTMENAKDGQRSMGVSGDQTSNDRVSNPYIVVLEKNGNAIGVVDIQDIQVGKTIPVDVMIIIFRIQILIDKIPGNTITPSEMVNILNEVIPGDKFYDLGDRWKEARDEFKKLAEAGKVHLDEELINDLEKIKYNTPWEDYPKRLRCSIGMAITNVDNLKSGTVVITSPKDSRIEKHRVFETTTEFLLGKTSEYLRPFDKQDK